MHGACLDVGDGAGLRDVLLPPACRRRRGIVARHHQPAAGLLPADLDRRAGSESLATPGTGPARPV